MNRSRGEIGIVVGGVLEILKIDYWVAFRDDIMIRISEFYSYL